MNESVKVAWRWGGTDPGSHATASDTGWNYNYVSIFQCWGDDKNGPAREQCQYGGQFGEIDGMNTRLTPFNADPSKRFAISRVVAPLDVFGRAITQAEGPLEATDPGGHPAKDRVSGIVPMRASPTEKHPEGEVVTEAETGQFFDKYGSNEVPLARTNGDGTGSVFFEMQTVYESQFLGCGARVGPKEAEPTGRSCWLVVVPRDGVDANGEDVRDRAGGSQRALYSSSLALSNWQNRIVFPLGFEPVREPCQLGGVERPVVGHESLSVAMSSWQGPLCSNGQGFFYATTTDDIARATVTSDLPKLSIFTDPLAPDAVPAEAGKVTYAPVAASGVSISLFVERVYNSASAAENLPFNGTRVEQLNLNQRLVAKLLTESYRYSTWINNDGPEHLRDAPMSLLDDPEFKALNADVDLAKDLIALRNQREPLAKLFVPPDSSDAVRLLWEWVVGDKAARDFLSGLPDESGMRVNQYYKGLDRYVIDGVARSDIPRLEEDCIDILVGSDVGTNAKTQKLCALDAAPYVNNFEHGAALASRGQQLGGGSYVWDTICSCVKMPRPEPQLVGARALLTLTDTPSSARRGLVSAALRNADGRFVTPTSATMSSAISQAVDTKTPGVKSIDPVRVTGSGYPLTRLSYAATNGAQLDQAARDDYASFLEVVATGGQVPGTSPGRLPLGYAPLPGPYQVQAVRAAQEIRTSKAPAAPVPEDPAPAVDELPDVPPGAELAAEGGAIPPLDAPVVAAPAPMVEVPAALPPAAVPGAEPPPTASNSALGPLTARLLDLTAPWIMPAVAGLGLVSGVGGRLLRWRARGAGDAA